MEDAVADGQVALQPRGAVGGDGHGAEVKARLELGGPLIDEVRRTQDGEAGDVAAIEELARDESGLDGLADANVVGDEQTHHVELERHQQRDELVGPGLDGDLSRGPEGPGAAAEREQEGVAEEGRRAVTRGLLQRRRGEGRLGDGFGLEPEVQEGLVFLGAGHRAHAQDVGVATVEDDPLASARADEGAGAELRGGHGVLPRRRSSEAKGASQVPSDSSNATTSKP